MNETDIRNVVGPLLSAGEEIIWASPTDPEAKIAVLDELKQYAKDRMKNYLLFVVGIGLLWLLFPRIGFEQEQVIWMFVVMFGLEFLGFIFKFAKTQQDKIGGYALTRTHLYELDVTGKMRRKLDASKVRYALRNENGIALAPLGQSINSIRVMRWLPDTVTAKQVQAAIKG